MRGKNKIKFIITIVFILAIFILGLIIFFTTDFFRTKRSAFFRYFNQMPSALEILKTDKFDEYISKKEESPYIRNASASIQTSSNIADSSILDSVKFEINEKMDKPNRKLALDFVVNKDNNQLFKATCVQSNDLYGIFAEDVANGFIAINNDGLKRLAKDWGISNTQMFPDDIRDVRINAILDTTKNDKNHINDCVKLIRNNVPDTAYSKEGKKKIKINGKSYVTNSFKLSLNSNESANLQNDILEKVSKDSILMDYFASKFKLLNFDEEYTTVNSLNDLIKKYINDLKNNPGIAGDLEIVVYEYKQKNVRTDIKLNGTRVCIEHLAENENEYSSILYNKNKYSVEYDGSKYYLEHENTEDENSTQKIRIEFSQEGTVSENNIKNNMLITKTNGMRNITYLYTDTVDFTDNIDQINNLGENEKIVLNDYGDDELKDFFEQLRKKINEVYVKKGSIIGINLDPIFS